MKNHLTPVSSAVGALLFGMALSAQAQQAPATPAETQKLETVVVTGIRASLEQSINQKKRAASLVEVVHCRRHRQDARQEHRRQRCSGCPVSTISSAGATEGGFDENDRVSMRGTNPSLTLTHDQRPPGVLAATGLC